MALSQTSSRKHTRSRSTVTTLALVALAVAFATIGNITAAGPAVYRAHSMLPQAR
ncbi:MAG: hypothetical protein QOF41_330 [Methylobacteriaceae bacterium]|nr:hypothetical protein [Methylobacteriaceae bacterium]